MSWVCSLPSGLLMPAGTLGSIRGSPALLSDQDRSRWDHVAISTAVTVLREALDGRNPSRFALIAAIAAVHDEAREWDDTDWLEIVGLCDLPLETWPSPVIAMNRAIALGFASGPNAGAGELDRLAGEPALAGYGYVAARASFLRRLGRVADAKIAYQEAVIPTENTAEREFLTAALDKLRI